MNARQPVTVVFDTNVVVALLVFVDPALSALQTDWEQGRWAAVANDETLAEFDRVLRYPEMKLTESSARELSDRYRSACTIVESAQTGTIVTRLPQCRDPDDQKFLELAQRSNAAYLLTRDKALLSLRRRVAFAIVAPERFTPASSPAASATGSG